MKVSIEIDHSDVGVLVGVLVREVSMLNGFLEDADFDKERYEGLLAEKAEIIKKLGEAARNKVTGTKKPNPKKVGRPKGSKNKA